MPSLPHHVIQRGNRRQRTFFKTSDYRTYIALMNEFCTRYGVTIWAYCLMPNHVHLVAVPETQDALCQAIGEAHRRYTRKINTRHGWKGHLWQGRFASYPMDERHLLASARYIEMNPVRSGLVDRPEAWPWSSCRAHIAGRDDPLVEVDPLLGLIGNWKDFLMADSLEGEVLRTHERTGRPAGDGVFVKRCERVLQRDLGYGKAGPKGPWKHKKRGVGPGG